MLCIICFYLLSIQICSADTLDYMFYFQARNQAEQSIARMNFRKAFHIYDSTFSIFPKRRLRDLHNAALCAIHCDFPAKAQQWILESVRGGLKIEDYDVATFKQQSSDFWLPIEHHYEAARSVYLAKVAEWQWFKTLCDTMNNREQYAINKLPDVVYDSMRYAHAQILYSVLDSIGIPPVPMFFDGTELFHHAVFLHNFKLRNSLLYDNDIDTTKFPYCNMDMRRYDLEPLLLNAIRSGDVEPDEIFYFAQSNKGTDKGTLGVHGLTPYGGRVDYHKKNIIMERLGFVDVDKLNAERRKFGLATVEDVMRTSYELVLFYNPQNYPFDELLQVLADNNCYTSVYKKCKDSKERSMHNAKCNSAKRKVLKKHRENVVRDIMMSIQSETPEIQKQLLIMDEFRLSNWRQVYSLWDVIDIKDE